jgi:SAM-dependent methyltransferase
MIPALMSPLEEPLVESAALAWKLAPQFCGKDPESDGSCSWYHRIWQYLRIMGLASSAMQRRDFYRLAARKFATDRRSPRVLIAGTADYAMLALLVEAFEGSETPPSFTVVDVCETPLHLNRWYASRLSRSIETMRSDLLDYASPGAFDLICTDSVLSRFEPSKWSALAANWHALLRPAGILVTSSRLRPDDGPGKIGFAADQVAAFEQAVLRIATEKRELLGIDPRELARHAGLYARRQFNYPVRSLEQVERLLGNAGFAFEQLSVAPKGTANREGIVAPTVPADSVWLRVIARRP